MEPQEDLWKVAFPVGLKWGEVDEIYNFNWHFKSLVEAFEEGGMLYGKKVFVYLSTESQLVSYEDVTKIVQIPTIAAIESPFLPSDKIAVTSILNATEEIIPMKQMKMDWFPYIPFDKRDRQVDRMHFQIFILGCTQSRSAHLEEDRARMFEHCIPYFHNPFAEDELEQNTVVNIMFPSETPVVICDFDWELDEVEEFVDNLIKKKILLVKQKEEFENFVKERLQAAKKANREARDARRIAIEEISEDTRQAFRSMKFYKFYPQLSPDVPSFKKSPFISRFYGNAHRVL